MSRWDRPPGPKDVRWFLRLVGKVLIVTGMLMFGFVAFQLWGTGLEYARAQDRAEDQFNEMLERVSTTTSTSLSTTPPTSTSATSSTTPATTTTPLAPGETTVPGSLAGPTSTTTATTTATTTLAPTTTTTLAPSSTVPDFGERIEAMQITDGEAFGFIAFPKLDQGMYIYPGVGREDLKNGPGHFPETPMPGQLGNSAIAGHRTTYGEPFRHLDELEVGDEILVTMPYGVFTYRVTSVVIVDPSDREVIATTDPDVASLTLATCHPAYSARERLIIHAELDLDASDAPGLPVINYGRDTPIPTDVGLPGEDVEDSTATTGPTTPAPTTSTAAPAAAAAVAPTSTVVGQASVASTSAAATTAGPTTAPPTTEPGPSTTSGAIPSVSPGGPPGGPVDALDNSEEAFSNRWFSDEEAFPQVTLWAGTCAALAVAAYQIAKRFRNSFIGLAVGVVPFVVGLYFFYENVNRLLPAAL